jgi:signal-transduction protein with cAMP-binding, CBS, and nucleotidyltransferase domain
MEIKVYLTTYKREFEDFLLYCPLNVQEWSDNNGNIEYRIDVEELSEEKKNKLKEFLKLYDKKIDNNLNYEYIIFFK